jgi:glycosyltransferase involved in cell wall biosynthesis
MKRSNSFIDRGDMKVAVIGTRGIPDIQGGVESHCEHLYPFLVKKGCEVVVLARKPYTKRWVGEYKGVQVRALTSYKNKYLEAALHTMYGIMEATRYKPDIVHIHAVGPAFFAPLARLLGHKVIVTHHGPDYVRKKWNFLFKCLLHLGEAVGVYAASRVISISKGITKDLRAKYKIRPALIPNGVLIPHPLKSTDFIEKHQLKPRQFILTVGRLVPEKGFHDLVAAFQAHAPLNWKLVIAGSSDHEDRYSQKLKAGASKNIVFTGFVKGQALQELYSHAGLFVLPSYHEGLPIALLEAMSYGLSCVVSDIPANREVPLATNRFFKPGDIHTLQAKIKEFISKPLTEQEKQAQIALIVEHYNWESIAEQTYKTYEKVLNA